MARAALRRRFERRGSVAAVAVTALVAAGGAAADQTARGGARAIVESHAAAMLQRGDNGPAVVRLQRALRIPADGAFGPQTQRALRRFQRRHALAADGIAGPATLAALGLSPRARQTAPRPVAGALTGRLERIAKCESGGNPRAVGGGGRYRGKYQFTRATWRALGGKGDPAAATEAEQDRRAARLLTRAGTSPWPACG